MSRLCRWSVMDVARLCRTRRQYKNPHFPSFPCSTVLFSLFFPLQHIFFRRVAAGTIFQQGIKVKNQVLSCNQRILIYVDFHKRHVQFLTSAPPDLAFPNPWFSSRSSPSSLPFLSHSPFSNHCFRSLKCRVLVYLWNGNLSKSDQVNATAASVTGRRRSGSVITRTCILRRSCCWTRTPFDGRGDSAPEGGDPAASPCTPGSGSAVRRRPPTTIGPAHGWRRGGAPSGVRVDTRRNSSTPGIPRARGSSCPSRSHWRRSIAVGDSNGSRRRLPYTVALRRTTTMKCLEVLNASFVEASSAYHIIQPFRSMNCHLIGYICTIQGAE